MIIKCGEDVDDYYASAFVQWEPADEALTAGEVLERLGDLFGTLFGAAEVRTSAAIVAKAAVDADYVGSRWVLCGLLRLDEWEAPGLFVDAGAEEWDWDVCDYDPGVTVEVIAANRGSVILSDGVTRVVSAKVDGMAARYWEHSECLWRRLDVGEVQRARWSIGRAAVDPLGGFVGDWCGGGWEPRRVYVEREVREVVDELVSLGVLW